MASIEQMTHGHRCPRLHLALLFALALGCGGGSGGAPGEPNAVESDAAIAAVEIYGEGSLLDWSTHKTVMLRHDGETIEAFDPEGEDAVPSAFGPRITFSSPDVAWATGRGADDALLLLRSVDGARTWNRVDELPLPFASSVLALHVDEVSAGVLSVWIAATVGEFMPDGPHVWTKPLDREAEWRKLEGIVPLPFTRSAIFARRADALELLRSNGPSFAATEGETAIYVLSARGAERTEQVDPGYVVGDYATFDARGWIAGAREIPMPGRLGRRPAVLTAVSGEPWQEKGVASVEEGRLAAIDFANEMNGFACGAEGVSDPLCVWSEDGGQSWARATVELPPGAAEISDAVQTGAASGLAVFRAGDIREGLLETRDGGRSWQVASLPPLSTTQLIGPLARGSVAPAPQASAARSSNQESGSSLVSPPLSSGLRAFAVGDTASRGPTITGIALRSDDGGLTWSEIFAAPGGSFSGVAFVDPLVGWVVGARSVWRSDDGGESFVDQADGIDSFRHVHSIHRVVAADRDRAVIVARTAVPRFPGEEEDTLFYTANGGVTWQPSSIGITPTFPNEGRVEGGLCLTSSGAGVMVRYTYVLLTHDAGATWVAGPAFEYSFGGEGWSSSGEGFGQPIVACSGESDLWIIVGTRDPRTLDPASQSLWHSPDGGVTWEDLSQRVGRRYDSFPVVGAFTGSGVGWLVGTDRPERASLLRTSDRGSTWTELATPLASSAGEGFPTPEFPGAIAFATDSDGIMLTTTYDAVRSVRHAALSTHDGGETWSRSALPEDFHPLGVSYVR